MSNHPQLAGGSHLPDITVITPVFAKEEEEGAAAAASGHAGASPPPPPAPLFFVASRGHHADVGGITPGSMPPRSTELAEEGAAIVALKLVEGGAFQEAAVSDALLAPGRLGRPAVAGARCLADNLSDLRAQVAANNTVGQKRGGQAAGRGGRGCLADHPSDLLP